MQVRAEMGDDMTTTMRISSLVILARKPVETVSEKNEILNENSDHRRLLHFQLPAGLLIIP